MGSKLGIWISVCPSSQQNGIFFMHGNFLDPEITILVWFQNSYSTVGNLHFRHISLDT
jgi:hypothetical protein